jgi:hypothetical protein
MKLEYEEIEDSYDDTTQAVLVGQGLLLRTTVYSPHHLSVNVVFVSGISHFDAVVD